MNKRVLAEKIKGNKLFYATYKFVMYIIIHLLKIFIKTDKKLLLFVSFGGRYFNDSPKCIYDFMKKDSRFFDYKMIWAFTNPDSYQTTDGLECVKIDTIRYYIVALKARCWITNVTIERGIHFKGKNTYYFHTTHTALPKLSGNDIKNKNVFGSNYHYFYDTSCAQSEAEKIYQLSMFRLKEENVKLLGYPKNDELAHIKPEKIEEIKRKLNIPLDKIIILYAPTYRENNFPIRSLNVSMWQQRLSKKYFLLFRAHPIYKNFDFSLSNGFCMDVSDYSNNVEIMAVSDILISDYSGIFFEYAVLERPMFCFCYDYDLYSNERGLYFDLRKEIESFDDEEKLIDAIERDHMSVNIELVKKFKKKYIFINGNSTLMCVNDIYNSISR